MRLLDLLEDVPPQAPEAPEEPENAQEPTPGVPIAAPASFRTAVRAKPKAIDPEAGERMRTQVQDIQKQANSGKLFLFGRKPNGELVEMPGLQQVADQFQRLLDQNLATTGEKTMQEQYDEVIEKVKLVADGKTNTKALLITGAPSAGKTTAVEKALAEMGYHPGKDYIIKGGRVTFAALLRILIEQLNGMIVFDDCDSVMDNENSVNTLKIALNTSDVREISNDAKGLLNTSVLTFNEREDYINALSNALRLQETEDDIITIESTFHRLKLLKRILREYELQKQRAKRAGENVTDYVSSMGTREEVILDYARNHLPNTFNFQGRVIFVSNKDKKFWDGAIQTRCLSQHMDFTSSEMLDFIEKIAPKMKAPGVTDEQKMEVLAYIRELYEKGQFATDINFRVVMQCWDLRHCPSWKAMVRNY